MYLLLLLLVVIVTVTTTTATPVPTTHTPTRSPVTSIPTRSPSTSIPTRSPSTSIPTRSPTTPTTSTPTPQYVLFAYPNPHPGTFNGTALCQQQAALQGLEHGSNYAFLSSSLELFLSSWNNPARNVVSPNGTLIATAANFQSHGLLMTLSQAGICTGNFWTGLVLKSGAFDSEPNLSCTPDQNDDYWTSSSDSLQGSVGNCGDSSSRWYGQLTTPPFCSQSLIHLCIHDGPTNSPTQSPTVSVPTVSPTTTHTPTRSPTTPTTHRPSRSPSTSIPTHGPTTSTPTHGPTTSTPTHSPSTSTPTKSPSTSMPTSNPTAFSTKTIANLSPFLVIIGVMGAMFILFVIFHLFCDDKDKRKKRKRKQRFMISDSSDDDDGAIA